MNRREIARKDWPEFLESFGRRHRSWLATVEEWPREAPQALRVDVTARGEELDGMAPSEHQ